MLEDVVGRMVRLARACKESSLMSKKPTQKKTPFVIEPLNWVAPDAKRAKSESDQNDPRQPSGKRDEKE